MPWDHNLMLNLYSALKKVITAVRVHRCRYVALAGTGLLLDVRGDQARNHIVGLVNQVLCCK